MTSTLRFYKGDITQMTGNNIFVYGANPEFKNGSGTAKLAREFGAKPYGGKRGIVGNTYGLITKNLTPNTVDPDTGECYVKTGFRSLSLSQIRENVERLYQCAREHPHLTFFIAYKVEFYPNGRLKPALNGYNASQMWTVFTDNVHVPDNIRFHNSFRRFIPAPNPQPE